jgi:PAS domain S-box-containing protein
VGTVKKSEETLMQSHSVSEYLRYSKELSCIIVTTDTEGNIINVNENFCKISKFTEQELLGKNMRIVNSRFHATTFFSEIWNTLLSGNVWKGEIKNKAKDGSFYWVETTIIPFNNEAGNSFQYTALQFDITARKVEEEKLLDSFKDKENVLNRITDSVFILDNEWRYKFVNNTAKNFNQQGNASVLGKTVWEIHPDLVGTVFESKYREAMLTKKTVVFEDFSEPLNTWFSVNVYASEEGLTVLTKNINGRKIAEQKLISNEKQLQKAQEIGKIGYWQQDLNSGKVWASKEAMKIYGFPAIEGELDYEIVEACIFEKEIIHQAIKDIIEKNLKYNIVYRIQPHNGESIRYIESAAELELDKNGNPWLLVGVLRDITESKLIENELINSEEKYRYLFHNNPATVIIWDLENLKILEVNQQSIELYGYTRDEFLELRVLDIRPAADRNKIKKFSQEILNNNISKAKKTWRHLKKNGELMYMDITSHKIEFNNRKAILSLAVDITEQVKAENQLKDSYDDIRRLNAHLLTIREDERTSIAREIHDELGQQLTGLKMDASWLLKKATGIENDQKEKLSQMISLIDETVKTVRRISRDLRPGILDDLGLVAALEWQSCEFENRTGVKCDFKAFVSELMLNKNATIGIFRIYQESLTNIMRHANATLVNAYIKSHDNLIELSIQDNGVGFDKNLIKAKRTLGLTGLSERAIMLGGNLNIESEKGKGTRIVFEMPID